MNDGRFFTITLMVLSLAILAVAILVFPTFIVKETDSDNVSNYGFADLWDEDRVALPQLTAWAINFSHSKQTRIIGVLLYAALALAVEIFTKRRKLAGIFHLFTLLIGIAVGWLILISIFLPYMPM